MDDPGSPGYNFKPGTLAVRWRRNPEGLGPDFVFYYPTNPSDGHLLHSVFDCSDIHNGNTLIEELDRRGYDLSTLQFTIRKKSSK